MDDSTLIDFAMDLAPTHKDKHNILLHGSNCTSPERVATLTPIRCRKVAPALLHSNPNNSAWKGDETKCDIISSDLQANKKYSNFSDDERNDLLSSSSDNDSSSTSNELPEEQKPTCTYIVVPDKSSQCEQLPFLSSINTKCQSIDDEPVSLDIRKNKKQETRRPLFRFLCPPYFILAASILEISVFFWGGTQAENLLVYSPRRRHEVWRFISYMLLHSGGIHLTLNIIIQTLLATPLELEQGSWRCAAVYLGGGLAGALGASVLQPTLFMVGASAGVYALLMSHLANVILRFSQMKYRLFRVFSVAVLAASDIAFSVAHWWTADSNAPRIGWAAHCAGAAAGATLGILVYSGCDEGTSYVRIIRWTSFVLIIIGIMASVICNLFVVKIT